MNYIPNPELGYYVCNDIAFTSKIEACIYSTKNNKPIQWFFNDELFGRNHWSVEPEETLDQLYNKRSKSIREKYDYIALSYSGGADSHNILESFLRQNLFIDEILVNVFEKANKLYKDDPLITDNWNYGAEYALQIYPRLNEIKSKSPNTKITVMDMSDAVFDSLRSAGDASWILDKRETLNVSGATRYNYAWFKDIKKQFDKDKKIVLLVGEGKPMTFIRDGEFYITFSDKSANVITAQEHLGDHPNTHVELYYWHPDSLPIMTKQAHIIRKWLTVHPAMISIWTPKTREEFDANNGKYYQKLLRNIIYTTWNDSWFQTDKSKLTWYDEIDTWFHQLYHETTEYKIWLEGVNYVANNAGDYVHRDPVSNRAEGLRGFIKTYHVGKMPGTNYLHT
jgi:hypothetical protein